MKVHYFRFGVIAGVFTNTASVVCAPLCDHTYLVMDENGSFKTTCDINQAVKVTSHKYTGAVERTTTSMDLPIISAVLAGNPTDMVFNLEDISEASKPTQSFQFNSSAGSIQFTNVQDDTCLGAFTVSSDGVLACADVAG